MGNRNYNDGTGGASGPGNFDGESNGNSAVVSVDVKSSLGSASRPPRLDFQTILHSEYRFFFTKNVYVNSEHLGRSA